MHFPLELGRVEIRGLNLAKRGTRLRFIRAYYEWRSASQKLIRKVVRAEDVIICSRVSVSLYRSFRGYQDCLSIEFRAIVSYIAINFIVQQK